MNDGDRSHQRRCWACGNVEEHKDSITPWVLCSKCGSQDTRRVKRLEPQKYPDYQVPSVEQTPVTCRVLSVWCHRERKDIDYEDGLRDARDLLLIVSPNVTPMESLSGIVSQLNNYIAGLRADRDERAIQKGRFFAAMEVLQDENHAMRNEVASVLMLLDELAELWGDEGKYRACRDRLRNLVSK